MMSKLCVLCDEKAITTAAHIPVCKAHFEAYANEGRKYLPESQRRVWQAIQRAAQRVNAMKWENDERNI